MSRIGEIKDEHIVLDPCAGPGIFIKKLIETGIDNKQIFAFDINSSFLDEFKKLGVSYKIQDTLLVLYPDSYNKFDFIIGNPPYLNKASAYVRNNKIKLKKIYGRINAHETYAMFIINSIWRLKEGGKLGFITSDSFLTLSTHKKLRKFILNSCKIIEILLAPKNLFSNQNVNTSPAIIVLQKCSGHKNKGMRENNLMRIIPRIISEENYYNPPIVKNIKQIKYNSLPFNIFFTNVEEEILKLFENAPKLEDFLRGYIGMHTHNNKKFIAAIDGSELADIFRERNNKILNHEKKFKIINNQNFKSNKWKPYFKRGGGDQYYRPIMEALDWKKESIQNYDIPKNVPFEKEGLIISGVSSRLAARYMPTGCYWDSNKAIGFIIKNQSISIPYVLGLLNSSLYNYLAKGIINNTNSIQISGIHVLPFITPRKEIKENIEILVTSIINEKKRNLNYDYQKKQKLIDETIFNFYAEKYNFPSALKKKLDKEYSIYRD
ncbi:MAG: N-6 DNA methylase [Candidatus Lokiarchaeia archaeon]|nr:N-6 DNA methylase [Candidatus Lokiarchaeia archaeon]